MAVRLYCIGLYCVVLLFNNEVIMAIRNWGAVMAIVDSVGMAASLSLPAVPAGANTMPEKARSAAIEYDIQRGDYGETLQDVPEESALGN